MQLLQEETQVPINSQDEQRRVHLVSEGNRSRRIVVVGDSYLTVYNAQVVYKWGYAPPKDEEGFGPSALLCPCAAMS